MTPEPFQVYLATAVLVFFAGLTGVVLCRHFFKKILAVAMLSNAGFLALVATGYRDSGTAGDPVPHAMVITGIVVGVSACAFALALARRVTRVTGRSDFATTMKPKAPTPQPERRGRG